MPVVVIRHAHAGTKRETHGCDGQRHLSHKGRRQARDLVSTLQAYAPQRILSSPAAVCKETVAPLAQALHLDVEEAPALAAGSAEAALALVRSLAQEKVALCTHGDVIPEILVPLADEDHLDLGPRPRQAKGSAWVLEESAGRFVRAVYLAPPG